MQTIDPRGERGATAITVGLSMLMLVMAGGAAIDIGKAVYVRSSLQATVDSGLKAAAAAAVSEPMNYTAAQKQEASEAIIRSYIKANNQLKTGKEGIVDFNLDDPEDFKVVYVDEGDNEDTIVATLNADIQNAFAAFFIPTIPVTIEGRIKRPRAAPRELALVLDVTASMADKLTGGSSKIVELKAAATQLTDLVLQSKFAKVGIVPFAQQVNIFDMDWRNKNWLEVRSNKVCDVPPCNTMCKPPVLGTCDGGDGSTYSCWIKQCTGTCGCRTQGFDGCVPARGRTVKATGTWIPLSDLSNPYGWKYIGQGVVCQVPEMVDLTSGDDYGGTGASFIRDKINGLHYLTDSTQGNTFLPVGLAWGWNMLDPDEPLTRDATPAGQEEPRKTIVLITDGDNWWTPTGSGNGGYAGPSQSANDLTKETCSNIKAANIQIVAVALAITNPTTKEMLQACATPGDGHYFDVSDAAGLKTAFEKIGASFSYNSLKE